MQKQIIEKEKDIDLLLLLDCTSSMQSWIKESGENLIKVIQTVKNMTKFGANIRAAFVGYRDFGDRGDVDHFDYIDYSTNLDKVSEKIRQAKAEGGGDVAEDVKGALDFAYKLSHKSPNLLVFMICDAPNHGS